MELLRAGRTDPARKLADEAVPMYDKGKSARRPAISATLVGVCIVLDHNAPDKVVVAVRFTFWGHPIEYEVDSALVERIVPL